MHNMLKLLILLTSLSTACAPPTRSLCFNPDPNSGICRDAELLQAEKDKERENRERRTRRLAELKQNLQLANTQLVEKKEEIAAATDSQTITRLSREHDALVDEIINYQVDILLNFDEDLGTYPDKIGEHEQPITLHLKHDEATNTLLPMLSGLDNASAVQVSYHAVQHKFAVNNIGNKTKPVALPETLEIPLQLQFTLNQVIYCGHVVIDAKNSTGGKVVTQIAPEEDC